jgi:hypothetical protein
MPFWANGFPPPPFARMHNKGALIGRIHAVLDLRDQRGSKVTRAKWEEWTDFFRCSRANLKRVIKLLEKSGEIESTWDRRGLRVRYLLRFKARPDLRVLPPPWS